MTEKNRRSATHRELSAGVRQRGRRYGITFREPRAKGVLSAPETATGAPVIAQGNFTR